MSNKSKKSHEHPRHHLDRRQRKQMTMDSRPLGRLGTTQDESNDSSLPKELLPITLGVFAQMLGEGISLSSLPLYLTRLGSPPLMVGLAISCFSISQMTFAPVLVGLSSRVGRNLVLRICLAGAAASSLLIAVSGSIWGVIAGRALAGVFAACVPVAQSAVTDIVAKDQLALGLSRVSAASQLGVVVGPLVSAIFQEGFATLGLSTDQCLPAVFVMTAFNALLVLTQMTFMDQRRTHVSDKSPSMASKDKNPKDGKDDNGKSDKEDAASEIRFSQPLLRMVTIVVGWTAVLSNSIYGLFAPRYMGFQQPQLSVTYSTAAVLMIATQIIFPKLVSKIGEHRACTLGIFAVGTGIGGQSLFRVQPIHSALYMMNRAGAAIADTSTAALVASTSSRANRSRNLGLLTSTRAAARIFSPLLSSKLFELGCKAKVAPGALPFVVAAGFCMAVAPLPSVLRRAELRDKRKRKYAQ